MKPTFALSHLSGSSISLFAVVIVVCSVVAIATDLKSGKIYNWLTLPMLALGLAASFGGAALGSGALGVVDSLLGAGLGLILLGWMFALGMMGGGDVKFMMALGAWGGAKYALETALLAILVGGVFAIGLLILRKKFFGREGLARRLYRFLVSLSVPALETEFVQVDRSQTMPFGVPLAIAASWTAIAPPLARWGLTLWA